MAATIQREIISAYRHRGLECVCGNLRMASRAITSIYDAHLRGSGLTSSQLALLWCVLARERAAMGEIAQTLLMDKTTVSRNVAALVASGLVRVRSGSDERCRTVSLTAKGRRAFVAAMPAWESAQAEAARIRVPW